MGYSFGPRARVARTGQMGSTGHIDLELLSVAPKRAQALAATTADPNQVPAPAPLQPASTGSTFGARPWSWAVCCWQLRWSWGLPPPLQASQPRSRSSPCRWVWPERGTQGVGSRSGWVGTSWHLSCLRACTGACPCCLSHVCPLPSCTAPAIAVLSSNPARLRPRCLLPRRCWCSRWRPSGEPPRSARMSE